MRFSRKDGDDEKKKNRKPETTLGISKSKKLVGGCWYVVTSTPDGMGSFYEDIERDPDDYEPSR